jgi:hypothetical protein
MGIHGKEEGFSTSENDERAEDMDFRHPNPEGATLWLVRNLSPHEK